MPATYASSAARLVPDAAAPSSRSRRSSSSQQLVGVAVLLVVVDQPRVRRRRDDGVEASAPLQLTGVAVQHGRLPPARADACKLLDPLQRVEGIPAQEVLGAVDRPALALVLVAPVRLVLRRAREVEIEVRRQPR